MCGFGVGELRSYRSLGRFDPLLDLFDSFFGVGHTL